MKINKVAKAGIGYTIGNILIKGINFLAVPLFSRIMTTEQFGIYNIFVAYDSIFFIVIGMALHSSIKSAHYEFKGKIDEYTSSITIIYIINTIVCLILTLFLGNWLSGILGLDKICLYMVVLYSFGCAIITLYNNKLSLEYQYKKYLVISLLNSIGNIGISLLLMYSIFKHKADYGRIFGVTATMLILGIAILFIFYKKSMPKYNKKYWKFGVKYSLPIIPHGISQVLLSQFDRIMINSIAGSAAAGIYSLAGNIKLILVIITESISTAWSTWFYEKIDNKEIKVIQQKAIDLCLLYTIFTIGMMAIAPELIMLLGGSEYEAGKYVAIPMIVDAFVLFLYNVIVPSEYYTKKTKYIMYGTMVAAIINVITNFIFIRRFGYLAAAYTTLFSYVCYLILHIVISYRLVNFFVVPIKNMIINCSIVVILAAINIIFINNLFIRWTLCIISILPIIVVLFKKYNIKLSLKK